MPTSLDLSVFRAVNSFARDTAWLHVVARLYAQNGIVLFGALLVVAGVLGLRGGGLVGAVRPVLAGVGVLAAVALNQPLVHAVNEQRPFTVLPHALVLVHRSTDGSFPSDHATMAGAVAIGLLLVERRLGIVAAVLAILMAMTRVYVGAHFPIDVVAGLVVGGVVAWLAQRPASSLERPAVPAPGRRSPSVHVPLLTSGP